LILLSLSHQFTLETSPSKSKDSSDTVEKELA